MSRKLKSDISKLTNLLNSSSIFQKYALIGDSHGEPTILVETKSFDIGKEKNFKLYLQGTLTFQNECLEKYGTYVVLTKKDISKNNEKIVHSFHFDGNIKESKNDHPIFHMQFDNTLIYKIKPKKEDNYFIGEQGENRRIRIPTTQLDIFTFTYYIAKATILPDNTTQFTDDEINKELKVNNYKVWLEEKFSISSIKIGYEINISKLIFPN